MCRTFVSSNQVVLTINSLILNNIYTIKDLLLKRKRIKQAFEASVISKIMENFF